MAENVADIRVAGTFTKFILNRQLRPHTGRCNASIFYNFFFCQYRAVLFKGKVPVSQVDHPLDEKIPFSPAWINVYMDFTPFWIRCGGFLLREFGERAEPAVIRLLDAMNAVYAFAGETYGKNFSTTHRPFYLKGLRFFLIHLFDPHLMCIPSLHVMVMICAYTQFAAAIKELDGSGAYDAQVAEIRRGARDITEAILYVKQHSVNCVAAAMYAMTCFDEGLFPPKEAEDFAARLFAPLTANEAPGPTEKLPKIDTETGDAAREHIVKLYREFLSQRPGGQGGAPKGAWTKPLLDFLEPLRLS